MNNLQILRETQLLLLNKIDFTFKRFLYSKINFRQRLIGIIGPRGVGKTTLILQFLKEKHSQDQKALYILADNVFLKAGDLINLAREFHLEQNGKLLCIDEIHRYPNWNQELKNIYDTLPDLQIIFSGSSSLDIAKGKYDLSRRCVIYKLPGLSFREYLFFEKKIKIPIYNLKDIIKNNLSIAQELSNVKGILKYFHDFLAQGYYPFYKETDQKLLYFQKINNTVDKIIYEDIAGFYKLKTQNLIVFKQILNFLANITPGEININKLANSLQKNHATIVEYLQILEETSLIRFLGNNKTGHALIRHAKKVFLDNSNLLHALNINLGKEPLKGVVRELFILNQLQNSGLNPTYSEKGDFKIENFIFEVGGKGKEDYQIKNLANAYLILDNILIGDKNKIPLWLLGFLY